MNRRKAHFKAFRLALYITVKGLYAKSAGYYDFSDALMFVIEGIEKVRRVIAENRKLIKHKKLSNNTVIEIDNCSPLEFMKLQKLYEELEEYRKRLMGYKECFEIMGKSATVIPRWISKRLLCG